MLDIIGWIGAFLFCICGVPQACKVYRTKKTADLSWLFLLMWFFGEILSFIYVILDDMQRMAFQWPLIANYAFNFFLLIYLIWAKFVFDEATKKTTFDTKAG